MKKILLKVIEINARAFIFLTVALVIALSAFNVHAGTITKKGRSKRSNTKRSSLYNKRKGRKWGEEVIRNDKTGVLKSIKSDLQKQEDQKEYNNAWSADRDNLPDSGSSNDANYDYFLKKGMKYVKDNVENGLKKIVQKTKEDKKNSNSIVSKILAVEDVLSSKKVDKQESEKDKESVKLEYKTKLLEGKTKVTLSYSDIELENTVSIDGSVKLNYKHDLKELGVQFNNKYELGKSRYISSVQKQITERVTAEISSSHDVNNFSFDGDSSEQQVKVMYSFTF